MSSLLVPGLMGGITCLALLCCLLGLGQTIRQQRATLARPSASADACASAICSVCHGHLSGLESHCPTFGRRTPPLTLSLPEPFRLSDDTALAGARWGDVAWESSPGQKQDTSDRGMRMPCFCSPHLVPGYSPWSPDPSQAQTAGTPTRSPGEAPDLAVAGRGLLGAVHARLDPAASHTTAPVCLRSQLVAQSMGTHLGLRHIACQAELETRWIFARDGTGGDSSLKMRVHIFPLARNVTKSQKASQCLNQLNTCHTRPTYLRSYWPVMRPRPILLIILPQKLCDKMMNEDWWPAEKSPTIHNITDRYVQS